jgi:hypothetical protein
MIVRAYLAIFTPTGEAVTQLIEGLIIAGWSYAAATSFLENHSGAWMTVQHLPLSEAVDALIVYAAYENVPH